MAEATLSVGVSNFRESEIGQFTPQFGSPAEIFSLDNGIRIGGRLSINNHSFFGHELSYAFQSSGLNVAGEDVADLTVQNFYYNFVVHATPQGFSIRPFVTGGGGFSTFFPPGVSSLSGGGDTQLGFNFGGGFKVRLNPIFGIRFDVRDHITGKPFNLDESGGRLHNVEYSAGFSLLF